jgi:hypothetical protein
MVSNQEAETKGLRIQCQLVSKKREEEKTYYSDIV